MSEKNQVRTLMDRVQKTIAEGKAAEAIKDLEQLDAMGSDDPRIKLYHAMAAAQLGRKDDARKFAEFARTASMNLTTEAEALISRLK